MERAVGLVAQDYRRSPGPVAMAAFLAAASVLEEAKTAGPLRPGTAPGLCLSPGFDDTRA
ncbi:MAG TPA: hypothetical protein VNF47_21420 [Streptosporangiaceae bacterium]|nr:hypothetical protein [Streptosporangiaceae bacterium]